MKNIKDYLLIMLGATILSFGVYNIHSQAKIAEGGELGLELLLQHYFNISPGISAFVFDALFFILGIIILDNKFGIKSIFGTTTYSITYFIFEMFPPLIMDLSNYQLVAAIIGSIFVGVGSGIVVRKGGASGGDDSLALILRKITKMPIGLCYFLFDFIIILISLSYISINNIIYSFITALLSSFIINLIQKK